MVLANPMCFMDELAVQELQHFKGALQKSSVLQKCSAL
jgi:hypothetical protein